jgi:hypothetical protein
MNHVFKKPTTDTNTVFRNFFVISLCLLSSILLPSASYSKTDSDKIIQMQHLWNRLDTEDTLKVEVSAKNQKPAQWGVLQIFLRGKPIFYYDSKILFIRNVFTLDDGNLAVLWDTGMGAHYNLFVYTFSNGKITEILHTVSPLLPEFVYSSKGNVLTSPYLQQNIVISQVRVLKGKHGLQKIPDTASIYTWNTTSRSYIARNNVKWQDRLLTP